MSSTWPSRTHPHRTGFDTNGTRCGPARDGPRTRLGDGLGGAPAFTGRHPVGSVGPWWASREQESNRHLSNSEVEPIVGPTNGVQADSGDGVAGF